MRHPLPTASTSSNASTSEQRTGVSTGQRQTSSKIKRVYSDADDELRDYCQRTLHIPTVNNPLEWWAENAHRVPRLAKLSRSYLAIPAAPQAPRVRGFFPWQATLSPESGQASFPHMSMRWCSSTQTKNLERWTLSWRTASKVLRTGFTWYFSKQSFLLSILVSPVTVC
ncbi:hypothetical protein KUCAC02_035847 [Chaenocephalus aceratus]|nr:hypothetical protein KUCAC02_035847 [Chaenocephalus aceratus]